MDLSNISPLSMDSDSSSTLVTDDESSHATDALESDTVADGKHHASEQPSNHEKKDEQVQKAGLIPAFLKSETYVKATPIGVFEMLEEVQSWGATVPGWETWEGVRAFVEDWPFILRFFKECLALAPEMIVAWFFGNILMSLTPAISLYLSGQLMGVVSRLPLVNILRWATTLTIAYEDPTLYRAWGERAFRLLQGCSKRPSMVLCTNSGLSLLRVRIVAPNLLVSLVVH